MKIIIKLLLITCAFFPLFSLQAQDSSVIVSHISIVKAVVLEVVSEKVEPIPGIDIDGIRQVLNIEILQGANKGKTLTINNDYVKLLEDEIFWLREEIRGEDGHHIYSVSDQNRLPGIYFFLILFVLIVVFLGGMQGVRGLVSLIGSIVLILYVLLPGILEGYSPVFMTISVSSLIIIFGSYITHGFNKTTTSAVLGMITTVLFSGLLAHFAIKMTKLTGFSSDEDTYLYLNSQGSIDMIGLLFGGIIIGLLGVLYDIAITQAISVEELNRIAPTAGRGLIYKRTVRIGREHIGALVDTLAIAYVGVSLPLLLLFYTSSAGDVISPLATINREIFATEIIRIIIGSIAVILAVPITTFLATKMLVKKDTNVDRETLKSDIEKVEHFHHHH